MVQVIKNPQIVVTKTETVDGKCEVTIKLDLNINIEGTSVLKSEPVVDKKEKEVEKDVPLYTIPDFQLQKIKFGEKVK